MQIHPFLMNPKRDRTDISAPNPFLLISMFLGACALAASSAGCTKDNPYYCDSDQDCASGHCNLDTHKCVEGDASVEVDAHQYTSCDTEDDCTDPARPICRDHQCVGPCGDGIRDPGETCDGSDVGTETCDDQIPGSTGALTCLDDCSGFDTSGCHMCGDGVLDGMEVCDGENLGGATCDSLDPGAEGQLACLEDCSGFDTSDCHRCGNGIAEATESCDGSDFAGQTCSSLTGLDQGDLICTSECVLDTSECHQCGNNTVEGPEVCDGTALQGKTCQTYGYAFGDLRCSDDCSEFDTSDCTSCGNHECDQNLGETSTTCPEDCAWTKVVAQNHFSCGLKADGTVWCWGSNGLSELATQSDSNPHTQPTKITALTAKAVDVTVGVGHVCVITESSQVYCWGNNNADQTGVDSTQSSVVSSPHLVSSLSSVDELYAGVISTCAHGILDSVFFYYCWGDNMFYELARETPVTSFDPLRMFPPPANCVPRRLYPASGFHFCGDFICGRPPATPQYHMMCWGYNGQGQLGDGTTTNSFDAVVALSDVPDTGATGADHSCAILSDGHMKCWGKNNKGQVGDNSTTNRTSPVNVPDTYNCTALWLGGDATCATCQNSTLYCWGDNDNGELGLGNTTNQLSPQNVGLNQVLGVALALDHACFLENGQTITCSGKNDYGQLGDGTTTDSTTRVAVLDPYQ